MSNCHSNLERNRSTRLCCACRAMDAMALPLPRAEHVSEHVCHWVFSGTHTIHHYPTSECKICPVETKLNSSIIRYQSFCCAESCADVFMFEGLWRLEKQNSANPSCLEWLLIDRGKSQACKGTPILYAVVLSRSHIHHTWWQDMKNEQFLINRAFVGIDHLTSEPKQTTQKLECNLNPMYILY
jgi:hypothetical protein